MAKAKARQKRKSVSREFFEGNGFVAAIDVPTVYLPDDPEDPCFEPATLRVLDEVQRRVQAADLSWLRKKGARLYVAAPAA